MIRTTYGNLLAQSIFRFASTSGCIKNFKRLNNTSQTQAISNSDKYLTYCPNEGYIKTSPFDPITIPNNTLDQYVWKNINKWEKKIAAVCVETGRQYTFAQYRDNSASFAVRLQKVLKAEPHDVIAICLPNLPEYPIAVFGSIEAGLSITTVNPIYTADEISRQLTMSKAKYVVCTTTGYPVIKAACDQIQKQLPIICISTQKTDQLQDKAIDFFQFINPKGIDFNDLKVTGLTKDDIAFIPFSSGTTGLPKGVILTHSNIISNCEQVQAPLPTEPFVMTSTDSFQEVIPCLLPFFHIYGLTVCMISKLHLGCKLVTISKFTPDDLIKSLNEHKGTVLNLVPPIVHFLTNSGKVNPKKAPALRMIMTGAAPIGAMDVDRFLLKYPGTQVVQGYGLTESSPCGLLTPNGNTRYASVGFLPGSTEAKIVPFDSKDLKGTGPNVTGELCLRGPQVMSGYLNNDEANQETFYPGNWLRTGDVSYYDDDGYFYITDRMKELIKVKGFQVPPAELEEILRDHDKILDAAVIGIPHKINGEAPKALVVIRPGQELNEKEVIDYIASKVVEYKQLEGGVQFINEIPRNLSGKILRRELKTKYC